MNIKLSFNDILNAVNSTKDGENRALMLFLLDFDDVEKLVKFIGEFAFVFLSDEESDQLIANPSLSIDLFDFNGDFVATVPPEKIGL